MQFPKQKFRFPPNRRFWNQLSAARGCFFRRSLPSSSPAVATCLAPCPVEALACWAYPRRVGPVCAPAMSLDVFDVFRRALADPSQPLCLEPTHKAIPRANGPDPSLLPEAPSLVPASIVGATLAQGETTTATRLACPRSMLRAFTLRHLGCRVLARSVLIRKRLSQNGYGRRG